MSNKFEQLLDYLVNEEHDKANELFHEIVVEKSREIYASMIAEETEEDEDESVEEAMDDEEEEDESVEEGFGDEEESMYEIGGDAADDFVSDVEDDEDAGADDLDMDADSGVDFDSEEGGNEPATKDDIMDIADALDELKAEFEALLAGEKHEEEKFPGIHGGELDDLDSEEDEAGSEEDEEEDEDETFMREYRETVKKPSNSETNVNTKSPVSSAKGRPNTDAKANNIAQSAKGEDRKAGADGKSLAGNVKGEFTKGVEKNISNKASSSMKDGSDLSKVSAGHGAEKKGSGEQSVNDKNTLPR